MEVYEQLSENARIIVGPEEENYFDVYGEPEGYIDSDGNEISAEQERAEITAMIDRDGLWYYAAQRRCKCCGEWETVDGGGMIIGDIKSTGYLEDLERSALNA